MRNFILSCISVFDFLLIPFVFISALILKLVRFFGVEKAFFSRKIFRFLGVYPLINHYYDPQFVYDHSLNYDQRTLPAIDFNDGAQLSIMSKLIFQDEMSLLSDQPVSNQEFFFQNGNFESGDAEYFYQMIRLFKPNRLFEIGSGYSSLIAKLALSQNKSENLAYTCRHVCIEPYEMPWLEKSGIEVIRQKVELVGVDFFKQLEENDILFIDSSHIIRPNGDVLFEYLELLPTLQKGVIVHIHDIFTPNNYLRSWLLEKSRFWNEQYILEAFLSDNSKWEIISALNYLSKKYPDQFTKVCPRVTPEREPGSFYIRKIA